MSLASRVSRIVSQLLVWAVLLGAWECAFRIVGWKPWVFPAPSHVIASLAQMLGAGSHYALPAALAISLGRLVTGFALSTAVGLACGMALWRWRWLDRTFGGFFLGLQTLPSVC
jgi:NitT/TauT family transport system permease protein